ncbi:MAG: hypothetical protein ACQEQL_05410 [Pseudomonadota bacterium]
MESLKSAFAETVFESWFRNSKVVDRQGRPLVVFHATVAEFDPCAFNPLSHFGSAEAADEIALYHTMDGDEGCRVFPVFLSIKNPLRIIDLDTHDQGDYEDLFEYSAKDILSPEQQQYCFGYDPDRFVAPLIREVSQSDILPAHMQQPEHLWIHRLVQILEAKGYDGFTYANDHEDQGSLSYIPFRKEQVRPALSEAVYYQATQYFGKYDYRTRPTSQVSSLK